MKGVTLTLNVTRASSVKFISSHFSRYLIFFSIIVLDVDECTLTDFDTGCVPGAENGLCQNTDGSYRCGCQSGYHGDGTVSGTGCTGRNTVMYYVRFKACFTVH